MLAFIELWRATMLFVYGTLQDPDVLAAVLGRPVDVGALAPAQAPGHHAVTYPGRVYPALVAASGAIAPGLLIDGLDTLDLAVLDAFEGDEYRRAEIDITQAGRTLRAQVYLPAIAIAPDAAPWSLVDWTKRHKPAVIAAETGTATALRQRLTAQSPP